jgi:hypothetical protein
MAVKTKTGICVTLCLLAATDSMHAASADKDRQGASVVNVVDLKLVAPLRCGFESQQGP